MGTNQARSVGRTLAPWLAMAALYVPIKEHAGGVLDQAGRTAHTIHTGTKWIADAPEQLKGLIGEQTHLDTLIVGLERIGVDRTAISSFEESYHAQRSIDGYLADVVGSSAQATMDLNEAIKSSAPWTEPFVRATGAFRNTASEESANTYHAFIEELRAFSYVADRIPQDLERAIERGDDHEATELIKEYVSTSTSVGSRGLRYHDTISTTLVSLQEELRTELGDERYEQLRSMNERDRDRWGEIASTIGSVALAGAGATALRGPIKAVGGATGSTLAYLGRKMRRAPTEDQNGKEPELKWS